MGLIRDSAASSRESEPDPSECTSRGLERLSSPSGRSSSSSKSDMEVAAIAFADLPAKRRSRLVSNLEPLAETSERGTEFSSAKRIGHALSTVYSVATSSARH